MYWGVFTVIIVSPWPLKVLTNMHKFSIIFCAVLLFFVLKMNYLFSRIECCYKIHVYFFETPMSISLENGNVFYNYVKILNLMTLLERALFYCFITLQLLNHSISLLRLHKAPILHRQYNHKNYIKRKKELEYACKYRQHISLYSLTACPYNIGN